MSNTKPLTKSQSEILTIANDVVAHCKKWPSLKDADIWAKHWDPNCLSIEGDGTQAQGIEGMKAKTAEFEKTTTIHAIKIEGPFIGQNGFTMICEAEMESKVGAFPRMWMKEICSYEIRNGKIVREEFMYPPMSQN